MALVLLVSHPAMAQGNRPEAPVIGADAENAIQGRYIVVFKPGSPGSEVDQAAERVHAFGGEVHYVYDAAIQGFAATLPEQALNGLVHNPNIEYIEVDQVVMLDATQSPATWGLDRIDQRALPLNNNYTYNFTGAGVTAYIIDTGIRFSHNEFGGRATSGYDFVDHDPSADDCNGHGTHVAGTVGGSAYGVAKGVVL